MTTPVTSIPQELIELEACPFCGSDDVELNRDRAVPYYQCCDCGAEGPWHGVVGKTAALKAWNTRHLTTNQTRIAELEEALERLSRHWPKQPETFSYQATGYAAGYASGWHEGIKAMQSEARAALKGG